MNKYKGARKGRYYPKNPKKWIQEKIIYRSSIEQRYFTYFDLNPDVVSVASEKIVIPYWNPVKRRQANYYVDLIVKYKTKDDGIKIKLIEIKSFSETKEPKKPARLTENYKHSVMTYLVNKAKWEAADKFARSRGWEFVVLTEKNL